MKKLMIILLILVGCANNNYNYINDDGGYLIKTDKALLNTEELKSEMVLTFYYEPNSYTLNELYRLLNDSVEKLITNDLIIYELIPLIYLSDEENNSAKISGLLLFNVENNPHDIYVSQSKIIIDKQADFELNKDISVFFDSLAQSTKKYVEQADYPIMTLTINQQKTIVDFKDLQNAENILLTAIYDNLIDNAQIKQFEDIFPNIKEDKS